MDFSYVHIRYFIGYVYHICLQDTIQSIQSLCLRCQAMLLPMPLRPLLLTTRSGFTGACGLVATGDFGGLGLLLGQSGPGLVLALGVVPNIWRPSGERDLQIWGGVPGTK